ncbi:MAG: DEAD/DEAH box helicase [Sphingobacteriia bacterium]|nr:DEAD/DEAH box helicase [Sphingobacteriia bacterium]NCC40801.1 DEAD/DEAH box helicase [Gammaproteobacteria bacterium]
MDTSFDDFLLPAPLMRGLANAGFARPTEVQARVIPAALEGHDLLVSAATGSGKTAAFLLPIMERLLVNPRPSGGTRALVLVPTRELARQIQTHFMHLASYTRLTMGVITGGESRAHQIATLRRNPEILVATPGRLLDLGTAGQVDLSELEVLVLDEADRMLDMGFADDVLAIIARANPRRQSLLFSATLHHLGLKRITEPLLREPRVLTVNPIRAPHPDIRHQVLLSDGPEHKERQLAWLLLNETYEKALVFTNTREGASALGKHLIGQGLRVAVLHGELEQRERNRIVELLHDGRVNILVGTDVAARGLDIAGIERVINFDVPRSGDDYLHRTGRTGRAGEQGVAISLVGPPEWNRFGSIERYLGLTVEPRVIEGLKASFNGPSKRPKGRATRPAGGKTPAKKEAAPKSKNRLRDRKNIGKRRQPSGQAALEAGHSPPAKRPGRGEPSTH